MRCPHCGEPVRPGQETCFACGEKLRTRHFRRQQNFDVRIVIFGVALLVVGLVGFLIVQLGGRAAVTKDGNRKPIKQVSGNKSRKPALKHDTTSGLSADTIRSVTDAVEVARAKEQLERLKKRYETVKGQVLGESPTPEQRDLMALIDRELTLFQRKIGEFAGSLTAQRKQALEKEIAAQQREINNLISKFSRAPKNR
ncbi:MAG: zinc-ribbon domain-containing protein [candidate division WOR-3 bacterium]|jgi:predicted nucleic acid-binding Zn ribbon protein|nr:zinc-ribbon domain-containing protein [candidate division WOR-3 bacterium]MCR4424298.1 zinc-ribbon domain-containing protein [candidate division WOR-3 bacterium]MDH7519722.1 zinc ribbon domain-containing protein [bacterium]